MREGGEGRRDEGRRGREGGRREGEREEGRRGREGERGVKEDPNNISTHLSISTICIFNGSITNTHTDRWSVREREGGGKEGEVGGREGEREEGGKEEGRRREGGGGKEG